MSALKPSYIITKCKVCGNKTNMFSLEFGEHICSLECLESKMKATDRSSKPAKGIMTQPLYYDESHDYILIDAGEQVDVLAEIKNNQFGTGVCYVIWHRERAESYALDSSYVRIVKHGEMLRLE
jgi:hypothetical protein